MEYREEELLMLSGIQHYAFCPRQWALIHIEQQWSENYRTADGRVMHERVHDPSIREKRGNLILIRGMRIQSSKLGVSGECDVVEFHSDERGVELGRYVGKWLPTPIEYKRGKVKTDNCDRLQLCAQALCLEEMLCCKVEQGALYYGAQHHREVVLFTDILRKETKEIIEAMHKAYNRRYTPKAKQTNACKLCSLVDLCLPELTKSKPVRIYLEQVLREIET